MSRVFGAVRQLGAVVSDLDAALAVWSGTLGVGPFYVIREVRPSVFLYRGQPSPPPLLSLAFAYSGDMQIELIQQHDTAPSGYRDFLAAGREGCQHVSSWCREPAAYDAARAGALAAGHSALHEGELGPARFVYFDTDRGQGGLAFEISEALLPVYDKITATMKLAASDWDGLDPVRPFTV